MVNNEWAGRQTAGTPSKTKKGSPLRLFLEGIFLLGWLFCTGVAGYFIGHTQKVQSAYADCPPVVSDGVKAPCKKKVQQLSSSSSIEDLSSSSSSSAGIIDGGYSLQELENLWTCSHAEAKNMTEVNQQIYPKENNLDKEFYKQYKLDEIEARNIIDKVEKSKDFASYYKKTKSKFKPYSLEKEIKEIISLYNYKNLSNYMISLMKSFPIPKTFPIQ